MKTKILLAFFLLVTGLITKKGNATPTVKLTTATTAAADINQGTTNNIVYAVQMNVNVQDVTVNHIHFTLSGTHDNNDLTTAYIYFNSAAVSISGAAYLGAVTATFDAPHTYDLNISRSMVAGSSGYFIIALNVSATATDESTIQINGSTDPVVFGYSIAPTLTDNQSNKAGKLTIQAADITYTSAVIAAADVNQGTTNNIIYAAKMNVKTEPVVVNNIQFTLDGTHDNNDLTTLYLYYNPSAVSVSGAAYLGAATATFAAPHTYSVNISRSMAVDEQGYYIIAANVSATATDNKTIFIDGAANPVTFGFTTDPNETNNQANKAKKKTIQAADITYTTPSIAAGNIVKGSTNNIIYATKVNVGTEPVVVNNIQFTLDGTHDNDDLTTLYLYYNASAVSISGAAYLGAATATFDAPHTYSVNISRSMAVGEQGYYIIAANVNSAATVGHTVKINGATEPCSFGFTTSPNITDNQSNNAGVKTISASFSKTNVAADAVITSKNIDDKNITVVANQVYPNPANIVLNYSFNSTNAQKIKVQLTDQAGRIVITQNITAQTGANKLSMNVSQLTGGVYHLSITGNANNVLFTKQVIVQH